MAAESCSYFVHTRVAVRRIQIDREEWLKATQPLGDGYFLERAARPAEAEVSLAALLARRETIRAKQTAPALDPNQICSDQKLNLRCHCLDRRNKRLRVNPAPRL
jgi:hypothetical protein